MFSEGTPVKAAPVCFPPPGMATVYVRYKQVEALTADGGGAFRRLNRAGLVLGLISSLGMCVVANFQVRTGSPGESRLM